MNNLRKKVISLLLIMISVFLLCLMLFLNISVYTKEYNDLNNKIIIFNTSKEKYKNSVNPIFIGNEMYEVTFNVFGQVDTIVSYSENGLNEKEITELINNNLDKINNPRIGSLYTKDYIFSLNRDGSLLIINNKDTKNYLIKELISSVVIFTVLEVLNIFSSLKIAEWIVKPVNESFEKQKQFIYDASHELKTPIAIIGASVETLEKNPKEKKWLENIKSENERMNKLVINLLDLSKSEDIKSNEIYSSVNLSKIIKNKALTFESLMFENKVELVTDIKDDIMFDCNPDRIKELLSILMDNAIKHSYENSKITVSLDKNKNNIILSVKNRGNEIPISERDKIFERFYRIDKSRNRDENRYGLGLSIAKNIVTNHNGTIKVNCENGYTTFIVNFKQN